MNLYFVLLSLTSILITSLESSPTYIKPSKKMLDEYEIDQIIKLNLDRNRRGYAKVEYNLDLMDAAQYASNQLARYGDLETPYLRTCNKYVGYAFKFQGYLQSARKFFGSKICFNNLAPYTPSFVYDVLYDCTPKYISIYDFDEYGYATSFDRDGSGYLVRLFTLKNGIGSAPPPRADESHNSGFGSGNPFGRVFKSNETSNNATLVVDVANKVNPQSVNMGQRIKDDNRQNFRIEFLNKLKNTSNRKNF